MKIARMLVPVDADVAGDPAIAEKLVDDAVDLARSVGAKVTLAHVAVAPTDPTTIDPGMGETFRALEERGELRAAAAERMLHVLEERAKARGGDVDSVIIAQQRTVPEDLIAKAKEVAADLIVMATHGKRGLKRLVLGSVAERTAHLSSVPVLLLPAT